MWASIVVLVRVGVVRVFGGVHNIPARGSLRGRESGKRRESDQRQHVEGVSNAKASSASLVDGGSVGRELLGGKCAGSREGWAVFVCRVSWDSELLGVWWGGDFGL